MGPACLRQLLSKEMTPLSARVSRVAARYEGTNAASIAAIGALVVLLGGCESDLRSVGDASFTNSDAAITLDASVGRCAHQSQAICGGNCVDLTHDSNNCGECGVVCDERSDCVEGACTPECFGLELCDEVCVDVLVSDQHCGACDQACAAGENCIVGECTCRTGVYRVDGSCCIPEPGLELGADKPGNDIDENCDGVDGTLQDLIFVDPETGDDSLDLQRAGRMKAPFATVGRGIEAALAQGLTDIVISEGTHPETTIGLPGIVLHGGYQPANGWSRVRTATTRLAALCGPFCDSDAPCRSDCLCLDSVEAETLIDLEGNYDEEAIRAEAARYYREEGDFAGEFVIEQVIRTRIVWSCPRPVLHMRYGFRCVDSRLPICSGQQTGEDWRTFTLELDESNSWRVIRMGPRHSATF